MAEVVEQKSGVTVMKKDLLLLLSPGPGEVKADSCCTSQLLWDCVFSFAL